MKKLYAIIITALFVPAMYGQTNVVFNEIKCTDYYESASTAIVNPGRYVFDRNTQTWWALAKGEKDGWLEVCFNENRQLAGLVIDGILPAGSRISVYMNKNDRWIAIPGAVIDGPIDDKAELVFPTEHTVSNSLLLKVSGETADEIKIIELEIKEAVIPLPYGKIIPSQYSININENIGLYAERLWDGILDSSWYETFWKFPEDPVSGVDREAVAALFPDEYGNSRTDAEIILEFDGLYSIDTIKAWFIKPWQQICFEFWDGTSWQSAETLGGGNSGWQRMKRPAGITTSRMRVTFPGGWEQARYIGEIEVWGSGIRKEPVQELLIGSRDTDGAYYFIVDMNTSAENTSLFPDRKKTVSLKLPRKKQDRPRYLLNGTEYCVSQETPQT
ncbi:hypothetical protein K7I13_14980 [Brucepastera parasyntrophica]|uniref:hypothetical protein n=1 Tax=Brucepastera parasyntrophica TaxID=2880008 RepID=UPI00210D9D4C|nr:hypothetical protein [Brucepastera parasyntrophica]ULQ59735.1 hypothetical protein K7I13_14980 [Brucepastera parasyntrophica]